jgi:uncharacterized membrane protein
MENKLMVKKDSKKVKGKKTYSNKSDKHSAKKENSKVNNKLDKILAVEGKLLKEEDRIEKKEEQIEKEDGEFNKIEEVMKQEESGIEKLEKIEEDIKSQVGEHPLARVTLKDITKGLIGAFIGLAIHYTFTYGVEIAHGLTMTRATILFPVTFVVGLLFIYATGFRKVDDKKLLIYMPIRLLVLYLCALSMSILVLVLFYPNFGYNFEESYKMVAAVMLAAVVGACTADLLGKE